MRVTTKGEVKGYKERLKIDSRIEKRTLSRPTDFSLSLQNAQVVFLATTNNFKTLEVVHISSPAH